MLGRKLRLSHARTEASISFIAYLSGRPWSSADQQCLPQKKLQRLRPLIGWGGGGAFAFHVHYLMTDGDRKQQLLSKQYLEPQDSFVERNEAIFRNFGSTIVEIDCPTHTLSAIRTKWTKRTSFAIAKCPYHPANSRNHIRTHHRNICNAADVDFLANCERSKSDRKNFILISSSTLCFISENFCSHRCDHMRAPAIMNPSTDYRLCRECWCVRVMWAFRSFRGCWQIIGRQFTLIL